MGIGSYVGLPYRIFPICSFVNPILSGNPRMVKFRGLDHLHLSLIAQVVALT